MQFFATTSSEGGVNKGLNWIIKINGILTVLKLCQKMTWMIIDIVTLFRASV